ncbi:MAG: GAF domain-containing protein [Calothrix sp. SM1_7_51]|nr:GAF domain-containing protein [Calothrix sp. SM1_7_51]
MLSFQDFRQSIENIKEGEKYLVGASGQIIFTLFNFYDSLANLAMYSDAKEYDKKQILDRVEANQEKMEKWANYSPINYRHKYYLVKAEYYRVSGKNWEAIEYYDNAIKLAKENEYVHEEALAKELAAKFYLQLDKEKVSQVYLVDAYYCYLKWGALAKLEDLIKRYPQLLASVIQQEVNSQSYGDETAIAKQVTTSLSNLNTEQTINTSSTTVSGSLDLAAVIQASVALSGEIELSQLFATLMQVVRENAGASKCALILKENETGNFIVAAVHSSFGISSTSTTFPSTLLESSEDVPVSLLNYVKRHGQICVIEDISSEAKFATDKYITRFSPKSVLCLPIINQGKKLGVIYLETILL